MATYEVEVRITPWEEGGFLAEAVGLQGCWVTADTIGEALDDIREVIPMWISATRERGWPLPEGLREAPADVAVRAVLPVGVP